MNINYYFELSMLGVQIAGDGITTVSISGGYHGDEVDIDFTLEELAKISKAANAHATAYTTYIERGYENEEMYFEEMAAAGFDLT